MANSTLLGISGFIENFDFFVVITNRFKGFIILLTQQGKGNSQKSLNYHRFINGNTGWISGKICRKSGKTSFALQGLIK
jgi:hypothetical protein